jgi:hypothetical protein
VKHRLTIITAAVLALLCPAITAHAVNLYCVSAL